MEERTILREVPSGQVAIVWNGVFAAVQFNCNCLDAIESCHGMCCTNRSGYSVVLEDDEVDFYQHTCHQATGETILALKENRSSCLYFDDDKGLCTIYDHRPKMCRQWHCSPHGQLGDREIVRRDAGWMLVPVRKEEAEFVQLVRGLKG